GRRRGGTERQPAIKALDSRKRRAHVSASAANAWASTGRDRWRDGAHYLAGGRPFTPPALFHAGCNFSWICRSSVLPLSGAAEPARAGVRTTAGAPGTKDGGH